MPNESDLPESLRPLIFRVGVPVRPDPDFHRDMDRLIGKLSLLVEVPLNKVHQEIVDRQITSCLIDQLIAIKSVAVKMAVDDNAFLFLEKMKVLIEYVKIHQGILRRLESVRNLATAINGMAAARQQLESANGVDQLALNALQQAVNTFLDRADDVIGEER